MAVVFDKEDLCDYIFAAAWADGIRISAISQQDLGHFMDVLIPSITNHVFENREFKYVLFDSDYYSKGYDYFIKRGDEIRYYISPEMIYLLNELTDEHEKVSNRYRAAFNSDVVPNALHESYLNIQESLENYFNMNPEKRYEYHKTLRKTK